MLRQIRDFRALIMTNRLKLNEENKKDIQQLRDREILYLRGTHSLLLTAWKDSKVVLLLSNYHRIGEEKKERLLRKKMLLKQLKEKRKKNCFNSQHNC